MRCASPLPEVAGFPKNPHPAAHRVGSCCCSICDLSPSMLRGNGVVPDCRMRPRERGSDDQLSARTKQTVTSTGHPCPLQITGKPQSGWADRKTERERPIETCAVTPDFCNRARCTDRDASQSWRAGLFGGDQKRRATRPRHNTSRVNDDEVSGVGNGAKWVLLASVACEEVHAMEAALTGLGRSRCAKA
jgi:hypothetical protein